MSKKIIFIIGGARSGKSTFALQEGSKSPGKKAYIATAEGLDDEMRKRIENHKRQRGDAWVTYEEPLKIAGVIKEIKDEYSIMVIDCLTLWLSNIVHSNLDNGYEIKNLVETLRFMPHTSCIYIVSNEVGMGIVPENELARRFRDLAGFLNQRIAEIADEVHLLIGGIPLKIKG